MKKLDKIHLVAFLSRLRCKYIMRQRRISYRVSDISLKNITFYDIILKKEGVLCPKINYMASLSVCHFPFDSGMNYWYTMIDILFASMYRLF